MKTLLLWIAALGLGGAGLVLNQRARASRELAERWASHTDRLT